MIAELPFLSAILSVVVAISRHVWTFAKGKVLLVWTFLFVVLPKILDLWIVRRALGYAAIAFMTWALYEVVSTVVQLASVTVAANINLSHLLSQTGWGGWIVWEGPLNMQAFWDELLSCFSFWVAIHGLMFLVTKTEFFMASIFTGALGPRR